MKRFTEWLKKHKAKTTLLGLALVALLAMGAKGFPSFKDLYVTYLHPLESTSTTGVVVKNNAYSATAFDIKNSRGTSIFNVDSSGSFTVGASTATIDSFTTTAALDTLRMIGFRLNDVAVVYQYTPAWSSDPDTNVTYSYYFLNTDSIVVKRTLNGAANNFKSGAPYSIIVMSK